MNGQQIIDTCRDVAARQYEGEPAGAAQHEIALLRTKVLELAKRVNEAEREGQDVAGEDAVLERHGAGAF